MNITHDTDKRRTDLAQVIIKMLYQQDPEWREKQTRPSTSEMAKLAEDADLMIRTVDFHLKRKVHAYQLFTPKGAIMPVKAIESRFKELGWEKGKSHNTLRSLIKSLLSYAEKEIAVRAEAFSGMLTEGSSSFGGSQTPGGLTIDGFLKRLRARVAHLLEDLAITDLVKDPEALEKAVFASIIKLIDVQIDRSNPRTMSVNPAAPLGVATFMRYVCGADTVNDYSAKGEHSIRPYELFLFAKQQELYEDNLWISIGLLNDGADQELQEPVRRSSSILEWHGALDEDIDAWMKINDPQRPEPLA